MTRRQAELVRVVDAREADGTGSATKKQEAMAPMKCTSSLAELFRRELELCKVRPGETVVIFSLVGDGGEYAAAAGEAAQRLGATVEHVAVRPPAVEARAAGGRSLLDPVLTGNTGAIASLKAADLVIDLVFLLYAPELHELLAAGTRVLTAKEPAVNLERLFPDKALRRRVELAQELLAGAGELRVTNAAGTDVTYQLGAYPVLAEYGYTDTPGRWDLWPSGFVLTGGADDGVVGKVVAAPGDLLLLPWKTYLREPVEFTIEAGQIVDLSGGIEAQLLAEYMSNFPAAGAYGISHIGWGLNEKAKWSALATDVPNGSGVDGRAFLGNVLFSTGPNLELGGSNATACHIDLPMRRCSLFLDGEPVIRAGEMMIPELTPSHEPVSVRSARFA